MRDKVTRDEALALLDEYGCSENHIRHMRAVEAALRAYARRWGEDEEHWGAVGLLHDFEYDRFPDEHPYAGARILSEKGYSEEVVNAVLAHGETGVARTTPLAKALYAVDELTGFLVAVTLVRPTKDIREVTLKSVQKKWRDRAFAAAVDREAIERAAADMGVDLWEHVGIVLEAMQGVAAEIGLAGPGAALA